MLEKPVADHTEDALIREVNDELREEQMMKLWQRYGGVLVVVAIVIVVIVAGYQGWKAYDISTRTSEGGRFQNALQLAQSGDTAAALSAMSALSNDAASGYGMLAQFQEAALLNKQGDAVNAALLYQKIARENIGNVAFSGLANILGIMVEINAGGYDPKALEFRLTSIADDVHPYRYSARELLGIIALEAGDSEKAKAAFTNLSNDDTAPKGLRERAKNLLQRLGA
ncbi:hypothetical protein BEN30_05885 [Magnetovibrio blakemorei]|uniref:Ancillary SecYEG translocon subunit/Cell division coordinator CpoB TPR domain-containing protein n=1 Tax=Magnetovibrio blakemorei TaxID=28181 RepID=A0A1E5Q9Z8_9PROT|nr:hypothetical protein BEN30_05885 [Magnetovibrio blakemorei]